MEKLSFNEQIEIDYRVLLSVMQENRAKQTFFCVSGNHTIVRVHPENDLGFDHQPFALGGDQTKLVCRECRYNLIAIALERDMPGTRRCEHV